jgi:synaptic vesicle membrane protein VAT-1
MMREPVYMRQVWIPNIGRPEVLTVKEAADPESQAGQIRVRVKASGINFADILARMGLYPDAPKLPAVVGYEVSGVVDQVGKDVEGFAEGDRVICFTRFGGYADVICTPAVQAQKIPDSISFEAGAAIPVNYLTAWMMLVYLGNVHEGDKVLVHAAAGGVGQAAIQICKHKGAAVIGTASQPKHERLQAMGVEHCIDYRTQDFEREVMKITKNEGVQIALDAVGGKSFPKSYRCLSHLGRLFMFGVSSFAPGHKRSLLAAASGFMSMPKFKPIQLMQTNRGVFGFNLGQLWHENLLIKKILSQIVDLVEDGTFSPTVDKTFPIEEAATAHQYIQDRKNFGKVLLVM